jgi:hypothetical protein
MEKNRKSRDTVPLKTEEKSQLGQNGGKPAGNTPPPPFPPRSFGFSKYSWSKWSVPLSSILQDAKNKRLLLLRILIFLDVAQVGFFRILKNRVFQVQHLLLLN